MKPGQYEQIARLAGQNFEELILELEEDAKRAMAQLLEDTQESNKAPVLTISAAVKVAYTGNPVTMTTTAAVTVKAKAETANALEDPDQEQLRLDDTKVKLKAGDVTVDTTAAGLRKAATGFGQRSKK